MKPYPHYLKRTVNNLDGIWDFAFLGDIEPDAVTVSEIDFDDRMVVPAAFDTLPQYAGKRGLVAYRTKVCLTPGKCGQLYFQSVGMWCRIVVDGEAVCDHAPAYTAFNAPVPASDKAERDIVVLVDNRFNLERCPLQENFFDFYHYGGILRSVEFHELADTWIRFCHVTPIDPAAGEISVTLYLGGIIPETLTVNLSFDGSGASESRELTVQDGQVTFTASVPEAKLWSPAAPNLHTLRVETELDDIEVRFGLRTVETNGSDILVNGESVKLLGFCRHEAHPQFGPSLPDAQLLADIHLLKDMGCNFVRGAHYPQDQRFLDLCDELGLLVFEESMGWGQELRHVTDSVFIDAQISQTEEMVFTSFNHPSVIMWGFLNEGESAEEEARPCYERLLNLLRELDPSRLVTYASNRGYGDLFLEQVDVVCFNRYPGWYGEPDQEDPLSNILPRIHDDVQFLVENKLNKPFIFSEIGAGAIYGWRDSHRSHWSEEFQAAYQEIVCREVVDNDRVTGVALWQFCDCRTYNTARALSRPRGFNNKGILDEYRRPKLAYEVIKGIFTGKE